MSQNEIDTDAAAAGAAAVTAAVLLAEAVPDAIQDCSKTIALPTAIATAMLQNKHNTFLNHGAFLHEVYAFLTTLSWRLD